MYNSIFARSFSQHEQKKMGCGAFIGCLIIALCVCTFFKPSLGPIPTELKLAMGINLKMQMNAEDASNLKNLSAEVITVESQIICNFTEPASDFCEMHGDIRIRGNSSTIFVPDFNLADTFTGENSLGIKPYARKGDEGALKNVRQFKFSQERPSCTTNHSVPAIVFSIGGYAGNNFHDFTDVVIPLYITSRKFNGEVKFLLADKNFWWTTKFKIVLEKLSNYEAIDIDKEDGVHCFPSMILGLEKHKELNIDSLKSPHYSMKNFWEFLRSSYHLKREYAIRLRPEEKKKPRLLIISRKRTRALINEQKLVKMAEKLKFEVVLLEADSNLSEFSQVVNSCDVMMGVHGAGLTNLVFLPSNAVFIQVIPLGGLEWLATTDFGDPSKSMSLRYLEYKIKEKESSLIQKYPLDHIVFKDPYSIQKKGWADFRSVYLDNQNVKLDVRRFRSTLVEALRMLSM
ncbi:Protein O-linked-mannose beta-1,4-N-acetylglucosaminyltransferase 2 [Heracleum sosnowskyi]|uniref:Protein O-linked-mannose beta-1,4-N-acetylglucosaminyltransferase 2 n=1 Tax=Heracleum sosnowskyi TaxID=360622 RepID=A0AAD8JKM9_9APIA|nr:Protein O-linked-mannose beta-1,4-N-acetylglucosaminyltransferase 2 [Heracleum sosnowskyi]